MTYMPSMILSDEAFSVTLANGSGSANAYLGTAVTGKHTIEYSMRTTLARTDYEPRSAMATLQLVNSTTITCTRSAADGELVILGRIKAWR